MPAALTPSRVGAASVVFGDGPINRFTTLANSVIVLHMNNTANATAAQPAACCSTPEVWVVNGGTEFVCHTCNHRSATGFVATVSVADNQTR